MLPAVAWTWLQRCRASNVILLRNDDLVYSDVAEYRGNAQTPYVDWLAAEGIRFTNLETATSLLAIASRLTDFATQTKK